ncbi:hypothetical protein A0O34_15060 [Chryseobacterium glaciei]|uniref:Uncharacterized protein n=1 Tax=Chryseobacterium glaciei TaxID=1685010 RepID=A0A172XXK5_9FLAO|nr:hypothetical protein [Chryseobacterium glaciei]ANF51743.1 hypothetical protein A0O34_15060 [Chryseobacterium glaciei]
MTVLDSIKEKLAALEAQKQETLKDLQKDFPLIFKPLFEKSEKIQSVGWRQYTPYFNDGDECTFSANTDDLIINGEDSGDMEAENDFFNKEIWDGGTKLNPNYIESEGNIIEEFQKALSEIPEEFYKELFGDHIKVIIERSGEIKTEEYNHD